MALRASKLIGGLKTGLNPAGVLPGGLPSVPTSLPTTLPGVPTLPTGDGGLGAALAAAANGAQAQAAAAVAGGVSAAAQAANAAAIAVANKYGLAPAVVSVENGDYGTAASQAAIAILNDVGIPPELANFVTVVEKDAATAISTTLAVGEAVAWAISNGLLDFLGPAALSELGTILGTMGITIGAGAAAGSAVPVVGTIIGVIVGMFVAMGESIAHQFPCDSTKLTAQQFWRFADRGTLQQGDNCGLTAEFGGKGTASQDEQNARIASIENILTQLIVQIRAVPGWQKAFLAVYAQLRKGDDKTPALFVWAPVNGYQYFLADEVFHRLGDEFADWWIQQPGWLTALGSLPVLPVSAQQVWTTDGISRAGGALNSAVFVDELEQAYQDYAAAHGGVYPTPGLSTWSHSRATGSFALKDYMISTEVTFKDHGQVASNLPAMLASHIPGAIGRAIIKHNALIPSNANPSTFALAMIAAAQAADSVGSKAVSDYVSAHIKEVAPKIGTMPTHPGGLPWFTIDMPIYGLPGDPLPPGATPVSPPEYDNGDGSGGAAPLPPWLRGQGAAPSKPFSALGSGIGKLHTSSAGTAAGTASGKIAVSAGTWTAAPTPQLPASPVNTGLAVLTLPQKVAVQAQYVSKWFGAQAGAELAASYHLAPAQAVTLPVARTAGIPVLPNPPCACAPNAKGPRR